MDALTGVMFFFGEGGRPGPRFLTVLVVLPAAREARAAAAAALFARLLVEEEEDASGPGPGEVRGLYFLPEVAEDDEGDEVSALERALVCLVSLPVALADDVGGICV